MKKIIIALAAVAAAFSLASCSKEPLAEQPAADIKLDIRVAGFDESPATRAVKTSWVNGDKIIMWFDGHIQRDPDLVIKYDGAKWDVDATAKVSGNVPSASGNVVYAYESNNDLSKYTESGSNSYYGVMPLIFINDEFKPTSYTYTDGTLSIDIQNWAALSEFQVVVTGIDPSKYQLKCTNLMQYITFSVTSKTVTSGNVTFDRYVNGFPNADGAAFYFRTAKYNTADAEYVFTLKNKETNEERTYTVTGYAHKDRRLTAVKLNYYNFVGKPAE